MSSTTFRGGFPRIETTVPTRHYLDKPATYQIEDSTEAGQVYNDNYVVGVDVGYKTDYTAVSPFNLHIDPQDPRATIFPGIEDRTNIIGFTQNIFSNDGKLQPVYSQTKYGGMRSYYMADVFPWLKDVDKVCTLDPTPPVVTKEEPMVDYSPSYSWSIRKPDNITEEPVTLSEEPCSRTYAMEMDKLELGNRYARLKEVARRLVKIIVMEGTDNREFDETIADIVDEL